MRIALPTHGVMWPQFMAAVAKTRPILLTYVEGPAFASHALAIRGVDPNLSTAAQRAEAEVDRAELRRHLLSFDYVDRDLTYGARDPRSEVQVAELQRWQAIVARTSPALTRPELKSWSAGELRTADRQWIPPLDFTTLPHRIRWSFVALTLVGMMLALGRMYAELWVVAGYLFGPVIAVLLLISIIGLGLIWLAPRADSWLTAHRDQARLLPVMPPLPVVPPTLAMF